jgi:hypothetical protein
MLKSKYEQQALILDGAGNLHALSLDLKPTCLATPSHLQITHSS